MENYPISVMLIRAVASVLLLTGAWKAIWGYSVEGKLMGIGIMLFSALVIYVNPIDGIYRFGSWLIYQVH